MAKAIIEVAIENLDNLTNLIKKAQHQSVELEKTLKDIQMFEPKISYPALEQKQRWIMNH